MISPRAKRIRPSEEGYMLLAAVFLLALFTLTLSIAIPKMAKAIQRDREVETMERGKQYIRAIRLYYRKFGSYPPNVDALVKSNEIRFLRKKYKDPTTGREDWKPIQFGQNKAPTALGFFGQPLAGAMSGGGCNGIAGASTVNNGSFTPVSGGATDINGSTNMGNCGSTDTSGPAGPSGTTSASSAAPGTSPTSPTTGSSTTGSSTTMGPAAGQTFGGGGIIGFSPNSPKASILSYKKKNHYNEWEFVYDPVIEQMTVPGGGQINGATPIGAPGPGTGIVGTGVGGPGVGSPGPPPQQ